MPGGFQFLKPETIYNMIVHHSNRLHEGITNGSPNKFESSFNQIFTQGIGLGGTGGNIGYSFPCIPDGRPLNDLPEVGVETSKFFLHL